MPSQLKQRIQDDLKSARKQKDRLRTLVLSTTLSDLRNYEIAQGEDAADDDVVQVVSRAIKQRREAAEQMRDGGREELAEKEEREAEMLSEYTPAPLDEEEVRAMVREAIAGGADAVGPVMGRIMPRIRGRFDGKEANRIVREELGQ